MKALNLALILATLVVCLANKKASNDKPEGDDYWKLTREQRAALHGDLPLAHVSSHPPCFVHARTASSFALPPAPLQFLRLSF